MPIYEYRCRCCDYLFEAIRPMGDDGSALECPDCGTRGPEWLYSTFGTTSGRRPSSPGGACPPSGFR